MGLPAQTASKPVRNTISVLVLTALFSNASFQTKVIIDQTGNRRSEDVEGEKAPGNKQQKHRFVVSTDVFCRRLQCNVPGLINNYFYNASMGPPPV